MKELYYTYNNEALGSCVLLSLTNKVGSVDLARCCLALPFFFEERIVNRLLGSQEPSTDIESFVAQNGNLFLSFNKRYQALLPVTVNSLLLLNKGKQIEIGKQVTSKGFQSFEGVEMGGRFQRISEVISPYVEMTQGYTTAQLYRIFKIQL